MNIQTIVNESERGCGFRKKGGLYLVSEGLAAPCGKLPIPLTVCPVCGQGIKPSRGWTWINGKKLVDYLLDEGFITNCTQDKVIRFLPPFIIDEKDIYELGDALEKFFQQER